MLTHFELKFDEKSSLTGSFQYDLIVIFDSDLIFWTAL